MNMCGIEINLWYAVLTALFLIWLFFKLDVPNWMRGKLCTSPTGHVAKRRYIGMSVDGYVCTLCGYRWYEDK